LLRLDCDKFIVVLSELVFSVQANANPAIPGSGPWAQAKFRYSRLLPSQSRVPFPRMKNRGIP